MFSKLKKSLNAMLVLLMMLTLMSMTGLEQKVKAQGTTNTTFGGITQNSQTTNNPKKEWTIILNQQILPSSVTLSNIYIADEEGNKISTTTPKLLTDQKSVIISSK